jgi:hypothetical protein
MAQFIAVLMIANHNGLKKRTETAKNRTYSAFKALRVSGSHVLLIKTIIEGLNSEF